QESHWIKLGRFIFPGTVRQRSSQHETTFLVEAASRDSAVRQGIANLCPQRSDLQLTWGLTTHAVRVTSVNVHGRTVSADQIEITCDQAGGLPRSPFAGMGGITVGSNGRNYGPASQATIWSELALFGRTEAELALEPFLRSVVTPDSRTLPV